MRRRSPGWELSDREGPRREPKRPRLEEAAARLRQTFDGLTAAMTQVLAEKEAYVVKHRVRLVRDADRQTQAAHARVVALVDELAAAREELHGLRSAAVWAACYPDPAAGRQP